MPPNPDHLTLLLRDGEKTPSYAGMPMMAKVSDPGKPFPRLRRFFSPWRLLGKVVLVGVPLWGAAMVAEGISLVGRLLNLSGSGATGLSTGAVLALSPLVILGLWAAYVGVLDLMALGRHRRRARAYDDAVARLGDADILTPADLRSSGIREGLAMLGHFEKLLASVDRERGRVSELLRESLHESRRLMHRSVLDLIATERRLAEWSRRLGDASTYRAKLEDRREQLVGSYPGILDQCLHATDHALAQADEDPADLERSVDQLLDSCQRALAAVEVDGPVIDEQELLMYAAKAREAEQRAGEQDDSADPERETR